MKNKKVEISVITLIMILQTVIYIIYGANKSYLHMDEAYSFGLSQYDKTEIQNNEDFYNTWHSGEYFEDYLILDSDGTEDYLSVYENQKNDVHPPFYYLLLRLSMEFTSGEFSFWCGIGLNVIIHLFITLFVYLLIRKLLFDKPYSKEISAFLTFVSALTLSSVSNVLYIRMYALVTLIVLITAYLHIKLRESAEPKPLIFVLIGITALLGSLTHYYYLFFLAPMFLLFVIEYIKTKNYKSLYFYIAAFFVAAALSLAIFPHSVNHLFFGYRGKGAMENLLSPENNYKIWEYLWILDSYAFNSLLVIGFATAICLKAAKKSNKLPPFKAYSLLKNYSIICIPAATYFVIAALSSPWIELRYILPVCGIFFIAAITALFRLCNNIFGGKVSRILIFFLALVLLISPVVMELEPEFVYADRGETVKVIEENSSCPAVYVFDSSHNRFLDDILLFSKLENSYIAKDPKPDETDFAEIFKDKDTSKGIFVIINDGNAHDPFLEAIKSDLGLSTVQHITRLNSCNLYFIS